MNSREILVRQAVVLDMRGDTKDAVISGLVDALAEAGQLPDRAAALKVILDREKKMSTGLQNGVAIPHGKTDTVEKIVATIGIKRGGLDFDSLDGMPAEIIVLTLSPTNRTGAHIQFLADMSKVLGDAENRRKILDAKSADELLDILCGSVTAQVFA